jgi:drug/metabolite transporter (DMT)-like permease
MTLSQHNKSAIVESPVENPTNRQPVQKHLSKKQALFLPVVPIMATLGNTLLSVGMRQIGPIPLDRWWMVFQAMENIRIVVGVLLLIVFFSSYLVALSWADLTYVIPTTSLGYVLVPLVSRFYLKEHVSWIRWSGIALICIGVAFVAGGPSRTSKPPQPSGSGQ